MIDDTHDPALGSWVAGAADGVTPFPVQNLPLGAFLRPGDTRPRLGAAIGDQIFDLAAATAAGLLDSADDALLQPSLNRLMAQGVPARAQLRRQLSELLRGTGTPAALAQGQADRLLVPMAQCRMVMPADIGDFTDFFASIFHATNAGAMFRPDNPLLPNYKYVPVAYHGRASSLVASGISVRRPNGQTRPPGTDAPLFGPSRQLDYEAELGVFVGPGNALGTALPITACQDHLFGLCLVNDWSARDIQAWEYQPLGPFLAKSFATSISPWVVTLEALAPFRTHAFARPAGDPAPLPHLTSPADMSAGGFDIDVTVHLASARMRAEGLAPMRISRANFATCYWTVAQMLAHHTSNGCNMRPGDLLGSGTISGPEPGSYGSLLEVTRRGAEKLRLPTGELRGFLEDGDEVIMSANCSRNGFATIGFGDCRAIIEAAAPLS